jgi:sulfide:quinone oxidoreductase
MNRVIILGGGFGGLAAAHTLRGLLDPGDEIMLIDRATYFIVGFRKTWALLGESPLEAGQGDLARLNERGIQVVRGTVKALDPQAKAVDVDGRQITGDAMVVALGAQLAPEQIPGLESSGLNIYDTGSIPDAAQALQSFSGGRIVVGIFGVPYKCPAAPFEIALMLNEDMREREVAADITVFSPQPMSLPVLGDAGCGVVEGRLAENGITFLPSHKATSVEDGEIVFASGTRKPFDLLLGIVPHRCPPVVAQSGLTENGGWVPVNPRTLETRFPGVYAIGDIAHVPMANGKRLPMAGVFAAAEGEVVARRIAAGFQGREADATFAGTGGCYLEVGGGEAMMVEGQWLTDPGPTVQLSGPHSRYLEQKQAFERDHLKKWFG